ncbi:MAG TPA: hypothetical protein VGA50_08745 [Kiloniellales bacterium]|jgi:hypothetical protein
MLCCYDGIIEYERPDTWPAELTELFERELPTLEAYERRRAGVDAIYRQDVMARVNVPPNAHKPRRDVIVQQADDILSTHKLLGFHCTRLTEFEIADIGTHGLRPLDYSLVQDRLEQATSQGLLSCEEKELLLSTHQADDDNRRGMTQFVNCRSILFCENDVGRLFRSWGGEALYNSHENRDDTGSVLRRIGKPAIIVTAIPISTLKTWFDNVGERFLWKFLTDRDIPIDQAADIETHTVEAVPASCILEIITHSDRRFELLTKCSNWSNPID